MSSPNYVFFYGHNPNLPLSYLSQWYPTNFTEPNLFDDNKNALTFTSAESYMMYRKALLFGDMAIAKKILTTDSPKIVKALGRKIKNFNDAIWCTHRAEIVYRGNYLKFTQSPQLLEKLMKYPKETIFVEASPSDAIWGIGYSKANAMANIHKWGLNLLGKAISRVRISIEQV